MVKCAVVSCVALAVSGCSSGLASSDLAQAAKFEPPKLWINAPAPSRAVACASPKQVERTPIEIAKDAAPKGCAYVHNGEFTMNHRLRGDDGWDYFKMTAAAGEVKYFRYDQQVYFSREDPDIQRKAIAAAQAEIAAQCTKKGQPTIGMTAAQATETCWGLPSRVNRTETSRGINDQYVYEGRGYLYFDNGRLATIQRSY